MHWRTTTPDAGFQVELFNLRGVHGLTHGRDELGLGKKYRAIAERYDLAKYTRIAGTLRSLTESYGRRAGVEARSYGGLSQLVHPD